MRSRFQPLSLITFVLLLSFGLLSVVDTHSVSAAPANDNFANAITIDPAALPYDLTQDNTDGTMEVGEPSVIGCRAAKSLWWNFTPTVSGSYQLDTFSSDVAKDTVLSVWTGDAVDALTLVDCNDDSSGLLRSKLVLILTAGTTYRIRVADYNGGQPLGLLGLHVQLLTAAPSGVTISAIPDTAPRDGQSVVLTANTSSGAAPFTYQWYQGAAGNTSNPLGVTTQAITVAPTPNGNYDYWVRVSNGGGSADSATTTLTVRPGNDDFASAYTIDPAALPYSRAQANTNATTEAGEVTKVCFSNTTGSLWWNFTPTVSGTYQVDTFGNAGATVDTVLSIYTGSAVNALTEVGCNDESNVVLYLSELTLTLTAGTTYRIRVAEWGSTLSGGTVVLNVQRLFPSVSISAPDASASEAPDAGTFRITRTGPTTLPLDVDYTIGGTAVAADYTPTLTGTATIPAGAASVDVTITPVDDSSVEGDETVILTLAANANYVIDSTPANQSATVTMVDNDSASVQIDTSAGLTTTEAGGTATISVVLSSQPNADVTVSLSSANTAEVTVSAPIIFTSANWNQPQTMTLTGVDDALADGDTLTTITVDAASPDANYDQPAFTTFDITNTDDDVSGITVTPVAFNMTETSAPQTYSLTVTTLPSAPFTLAVSFDPAQVTLNGSSVSPLLFTISAEGTISVTVDVLENPTSNTDRVTTIAHSISASGAAEYPTSLAVPSVTITIGDVPPPPPTPLCEEHNFAEGGVVRVSAPDSLSYAINCRILYQNGGSTTWLGSPLYTEGNLGVPGLLELGVQQAIDIFSPAGLTYFDGGAVFCLRGPGTLIWLAASGIPRHAEIIGSYTVPEFAGFTCATLFEPGTLVLVSDNPLD